MPRIPPNNEPSIGAVRSLAFLLGVLAMGYRALHWTEDNLPGLSSPHSTLSFGLFPYQERVPGNAGEPEYGAFFSCDTSFHVFLSDADPLACCYSFSYDYDASAGQATALEVRLLPASASFSGLYYNLASGWRYQEIEEGRHLRWLPPNGLLPAGEHPLFDLCVDNGPYGVPLRLAVSWKAGAEEICRDTLNVSCWQCLAPQAENLSCREEGGYAYTFGFTNRTGYAVHRLGLEEPAGQDLIVESEVGLPAAVPPGASIANLSLSLRPEAEGLEELCFQLTASRLLGNSTALDCCTFTLCLRPPACDQCCTPFPDFESDRT